MIQFSKTEAKALRDSNAWRGWTDSQILQVQLFQEHLCMPFGAYHGALERVLGRPVYTHTLDHNKPKLIKEFLEKTSPFTSDELIRLIPGCINCSATLT